MVVKNELISKAEKGRLRQKGREMKNRRRNSETCRERQRRAHRKAEKDREKQRREHRKAEKGA